MRTCARSPSRPTAVAAVVVVGLERVGPSCVVLGTSVAGMGSAAWVPPPSHQLLFLSRFPHPGLGNPYPKTIHCPFFPRISPTPAWQQVEQQLDSSRSGESACGPVQYVEKTPNPGLKSKWEAVGALRGCVGVMGAMSWCGLSRAPAQGCGGRRRRIPVLDVAVGSVLGGAGPRHCGGGCPTMPHRRSLSRQGAWLITFLDIMPPPATKVGSERSPPAMSCNGVLPLPVGPSWSAVGMGTMGTSLMAAGVSAVNAAWGGSCSR